MAIGSLISSAVKGAKSLLDREKEKRKQTTSSSDPADYYLKELGRAQHDWTNYNQAGQTSAAQDAHNYANRLRSEAASKGIDLSNYGVRNQYGIDYRQYYDPTSAPSFRRTDNLNQPQAATTSAKGSSVISSADMARQRARSDIEAQLAAYQGRLPLLQQQRDLALQSIQANLDSGMRAIDDRSFQNYLQARQALADRGLNAGFESDMNTRLALARMGEVSNLQQQAMLQQAQAEMAYLQQAGALQSQMAGIEASENSLIGRYLAEAEQQALAERRQAMEEMKMLLPYQYLTANQEAQLLYNQERDALQREWDMYRFHNLSASDVADLQYRYYSHDNPSGNARLQSQTSLAVAQMNNAARVQAAQIAAASRQAQNEGVTGQHLQFFLEGLDGEEDTFESTNAELRDLVSKGQLSIDEYNIYAQAARDFFDSYNYNKMWLEYDQNVTAALERERQKQEQLVRAQRANIFGPLVGNYNTGSNQEWTRYQYGLR